MLPKQHTPDGFPPCVSLTISFNDHATLYQTVAEWIADADMNNGQDWVSEDEKQRAIATDSVWVCQWYPDTPVGFCSLAASSFEALMRGVREGTATR
jgi:hypothetical protein